MDTVVDITCFYCGRDVAAEVVQQDIPPVYGRQVPRPRTLWLRCRKCGEGSVMNMQGTVYPSAPSGRSIKGLPAEVERAWREARTAHAVAAYTASEMMCRKLLMYVAVNKAGSPPGKSFQSYVNDLERTGYFALGVKPVVDKIRDRGNQAIHELPASTEREAEATLGITEHLLVSIYEVPFL